MTPKIYHNNGRFTVFLNRKRLQFNLGRQLEAWQHIQKLKLIVDYIEKNPEPRILLHLDAPDVLVIGDLRHTMDCFNSEFGCDLLLGAEKNSMPSLQSAVNLTDRDARFLNRIEQFERAIYRYPFQHLNAGCFIGSKESILELFSEALNSRKQWRLSSRMWHGDLMHDDDQVVLRELHRKNYPRIQIDHENKVFQNLYATKRSEISASPPVPGGIRFLNAFISHMHSIASAKMRSIVSRSRGK